jgi:signal transduction histidine kinase
MTSSSSQPTGHLHPAYAYIVALLGVCLVIWIRFYMAPHWGDRYPYAFFFAVMVVSAWIGGRIPGLLAMFLGWVTVTWVMPHFGIFSVEVASQWMGQIIYLAQSILIVVAFSSLRYRIQAISEKQFTEAALHESQRQLAATLSEAEIHLKRLNMIEGAVNVGTWEFDIVTGLSYWPAGTSSLWGLPPHDHQIPLNEFVSRIYTEDRERVMCVVETALATAGPYEVEFRVVWPDRSIHWLSARGAVVLDEMKKPRRVIGIALEVTQRHQTEKALRESEKLAATGRMAATIAHEINNPLEAVVNLVYLAKNDPNISQATRDFLANADIELGRVSHIVRQTLGFYRENSSPAWMDAAALVQQITALYRNKFLRKNVELDLRTEPADVFAVEGELRQVISNLVSNAIDAIEMNGRIRIRVRMLRSGKASWVRILVGDNGHGIAQENYPRLFQPFFTTKANVGTGLGLWVSKGIIEKHNGRVRLRTSTRPQHSGTVFCVDLPVEQQSSANIAS